MKKKPARLIHLRFRKNDPEHNLHVAVQHFVKAHGGALVLTGPIQIIREPFDPEGKFKVALVCMGRAPKKSADKVKL